MIKARWCRCRVCAAVVQRRNREPTKKHEVPEELLSGLLANYKKPDRQNGLLKQLTHMHLTSWSRFDDKITSLYALDMTVREI
jgi:non-ribosomal peptide synthetase component E (peptide arylation enzyme)